MFYLYLLISIVLLGINISYIFIPQECIPNYSLIPLFFYFASSLVYTFYHFILKKRINLYAKIGIMIITILTWIYNCLFIIYLNVYNCDTENLSPQLWFLIFLYFNNFMYIWFIQIIRKTVILDYRRIEITI